MMPESFITQNPLVDIYRNIKNRDYFSEKGQSSPPKVE